MTFGLTGGLDGRGGAEVSDHQRLGPKSIVVNDLHPRPDFDQQGA